MKSIVSLLPTVTAGVVAVLVGFTSAIAILFQAAEAMSATPDQTSSMIAALCFGAGVTTIAFSLYFKKPVLMAFSTTGAALLAANTSHVSFNEMIGAFLFCALLTTIAGFTGWFERVLNRIPTELASAMLAGVLLRFGLDVFLSMKTQLNLVFGMLAVYLVFKRWQPRYAVISVLVSGLVLCYIENLMHFENFVIRLSQPTFTTPAFSIATMIGIGFPLFIVTMASQNLPGIAVMRASGYQPPISPVITGTGLATMALAPFGGFGINFAAITAAIVLGPEAHENPQKRHIGAITAGILYILIAFFAATVSLFFQALPKEFVLSLAGIALFGTITSSLTTALKNEPSREPAILTFIVTASGVTVFGVGSAFWGIVVGALALMLFRWKK